MCQLHANLESVPQTAETKGNATITERLHTRVRDNSGLRRTNPWEWLARTAFEPRRAYRKAA